MGRRGELSNVFKTTKGKGHLLHVLTSMCTVTSVVSGEDYFVFSVRVTTR